MLDLHWCRIDSEVAWPGKILYVTIPIAEIFVTEKERDIVNVLVFSVVKMRINVTHLIFGAKAGLLLPNNCLSQFVGSAGRVVETCQFLPCSILHLTDYFNCQEIQSLYPKIVIEMMKSTHRF